MKKTSLFPPNSKGQAAQVKVSPGIISGDHVFLTGVTGSRADGSMPESAEDQFRSAFNKIGSVLAEASLTHGAIVEMTTFHVGTATTLISSMKYGVNTSLNRFLHGRRLKLQH